jgi:hypothetical protein
MLKRRALEGPHPSFSGLELHSETPGIRQSSSCIFAAASNLILLET